VEGLESDRIAKIYDDFAPGRNLAGDFQARFGQPLDEETLNDSHQIVVVAASIDASTTRIVRYLNERDIAINILCFQVFVNGDEQLLSRAWLIDPAETQTNATVTATHEKEPWNGEVYASFGHDQGRLWSEARQYGFISAGGGAWYSNSLNLLNPGDRIWVKAPGYGFVGVGRVKGKSVPAAEFKLPTSSGDRPAFDVLKGDYHRDLQSDPDRSEYFVPVEWLQTVPIEEAVQEVGMFGNQNTICKPKTPKWRFTVERLKQKFPKYDT
jgi:hypothetical protein